MEPITTRRAEGQDKDVVVTDPRERRRRSVPLTLSELRKEPGPLSLNWLGPLQRWTTRGNDRYKIQAQFYRVDTEGETLDVDIPMESFHLLATGTRWSYGRFRGYVPGKTTWVRLDLPNLDVAKAHRAQKPSRDLLPDWKYPLHNMLNPGDLRILPALAGPELIISVAEIVRTWYLFHPDMLRVMTGDGINRSSSMSSDDLPWDPKQTYLRGDHAYVTYDPGFGEEPMKRLARLLFDAHARKAAGAFSWRFRKHSAEDVFDLPYAVPPLQEYPLLKIHYVDVPSWGNRRPQRRLVLSILGVKHPPPFAHFTWQPKRDNSRDPNAGPDRPIMPQLGAAAIVSEAEGVLLAGEGMDAGIERVRTHILGFDDNAYDVPTERAPRKPASYQAGGPRKDPVRVTQTAPDTGVPGEDGVAGLAAGDMLAGPEPEKSRSKTPVAFIRMRTVFDRAIDILTHELPGWTVAYLALEGMDNGVLDIPHEDRDDYRFLILHARTSGRHVYGLHGTPVDAERRHQLFACRQVNGQALTTHQFRQWLGGFPYGGGRPIWVEKDSATLKLIPHAFNHQQTKGDFDEEDWVQDFAANVAKAMLAIALG